VLHTVGSSPASKRATRPARGAVLLVALAIAVLAAACGSSTGATSAPPAVTGPSAALDGGAADASTTAVPTTAAPTTTVAPTTTTTAPPPVPPAPAPVTPVPVKPLASGASGADVSQLQQRLSEMGYWLPGVDGKYTSATLHAVTAFQKANNLPRTGKADGPTLAAMATATRPVPLHPLPGRTLEVDLNRQILMVINGGQVDMVLDISSGKKSTPTPKGDYTIQRQIDGLRVSDLGELWRPKYFTGGYALHGSPSVPTSAASHGCVRLTNAEIDWLWSSNVAPVGTPLFVY
jgi:peptidoglycan hydrolase-like protein with peptidoglycan-binding domain